MASPTERQRNNIRMGIFVTVALILAVVIIMALTDAHERLTVRTDDWTVRFDTRSGVADLQPGSSVRVGGMNMGTVTSVEPGELVDGALRQIKVQFKLDNRITLFEDAQIFVAGPVIGAEAWLDIPYVGDPGRPIVPGDAIVGMETRGMLASLVGYELAGEADVIVERAQVILDNITDFTAWTRTLPDEYQERLVPIIENTDALMADTRELIHTIRHENWPQWSGDVDQILERTRAASETLNRALEEAEGLMVDGRSVVEENRAQLNAMIENFEAFSADAREIAQRINEEMLDQIQGVLARGDDALEGVQQIIRNAQQDYEGWAIHLDEVFGNANIASQQLKLLMIEARRNPWKLLYEPRPDELEHELLYDAARSFAVAAGDLKASSQAVERIMRKHGDRIEQDEESFQRIMRYLEAPLERYERAQQILMDVLFETRP